MARVYKTVMVNGKQMKKWVEEYAVFEFDEDGKRTFPETLDSDERYIDYDENGNRKNFPWIPPHGNMLPVSFVKSKDKMTSRYVSFSGYLAWYDKKGLYIYSSDYHTEKIDFDSEGRPVRIGYEEFEYEPDSDNLIHVIKNTESDKKEHWFEYNDDMLIHEKYESTETDCNHNYEIFYEYDENENLIHEEKENETDSPELYYRNYEIRYEYDVKGKIIRETGTQYCEPDYDPEDIDCYDDNDCYKDYTIVYEYNEKGLLVHEKKEVEIGSCDDYYENLDEFDYETWYEYDKAGHCVKEGETRYEYNEKGCLIKEESGDCRYEWNWDNNNKLIACKDSRSNLNVLFEFDASGNLIHYYHITDEWYEYEFYDNGNIKKKICYRGI